MREYKYILFLILLLIVGLSFGCGQSKMAPQDNRESGRVQVSVIWPLTGKARAASIPASATTIIITVSADDLPPFNSIVTYPQTIGTLEVKVGTNRKISAVAKNYFGVPLASGEVSGLEIRAGENKSVSLALTEITGSANYFPSTPGSTYVYKYANGNLWRISFEGETVINGSITAQVLTGQYLNIEPSTSESYYHITETGVYFYGSSPYTTTEAQKILKLPLNIGDTWTYYSSGQYSNVASVIGQESMSVPAGTFDCYKVKYSSFNGTLETYSYYVWFGKGVGIVKADTDPSSSFRMELESKNF